MTKTFPDGRRTPPRGSADPRSRDCPQCGKAVAAARPRDDSDAARVWPFCSTRCRWADLSSWLDGSYRVAGEEIAPAEVLRGDPPD